MSTYTRKRLACPKGVVDLILNSPIKAPPLPPKNKNIPKGR